MKTLIKSGLLVDPASRVKGKLNLLIEDGKVAAVTEGEPAADSVVDAAGKVVTPGFIDIHMHEDALTPDGTLYGDDEKAIFKCMLRMGVTTVAPGQCGDNVCAPSKFLDIVDRDGAPVNVAMFLGHTFLRNEVGHGDKYSHVTKDELRKMERLAERELEAGAFGISFGIRYVPGIDGEELRRIASLCRKGDKVIAAHVRDDAAMVVPSAREFLDVGRELGLSTEVSHIGSMGGFGQMEDLLRVVDSYRMNGLDVSCDCYPYNAFCTSIGSTTYDEGWLDRYHCGYDVVEICEGKYRGMRCTKEIFDEVRAEHPEALTICYVMTESDVDMALAHPNVMLGSDGTMNFGQGHPRAAGAFPRLYSEYVRKGKLSLYDAVNMMTAMPAEKLGLKSKGNLKVGSDADIVIFDLDKICDGATFAQPTLPPAGIDSVWLGGRVAARGGRIENGSLGKSLRAQ